MPKNPLTSFIYHKLCLMKDMAKDCENKAEIESRIDYDYLSKETATVPFVVRAPYHLTEPLVTLSDKFMTQWFIHPLPLFFE